MEREQVLMDRKDRLLAKLEQRNEERKTLSEEYSLKSEASQIDELMTEIKKDLESKQVNTSKIERLQEFLAFSMNNRQSKAIQNLLEDVRKFKLSSNTGPKFKGFSFSVINVSYLEYSHIYNSQKTPSSSAAKVPTETATKSVEVPFCISDTSASENIIEGLTNENKTITGVKGEDASLKNIENCRLQFNFEPSIVHIRNVKNSTLIFLRCDRSLLIHDCDNVHIYVAAQQVRIHTSKNLHLHVATRGAVILEDSTKIKMYSYRLKLSNGEYIEAEDNGEWRTPRDFNWLATTPSPNWEVAGQEEWTEEHFIA
ncbi:hypothetical protein CAEBREN_24493 [Caenorhabditis brenneri]|uniref:C-CAP/cofactor C-like domain-containing protein n=1 Tax=Caenorhabditis brenneri TaxID=135651 RepID=G0MKM0_CAEBE|nr:hypothetical protein CAEBREN_24493 [Caenorhabditis brenneri]